MSTDTEQIKGDNGVSVIGRVDWVIRDARGRFKARGVVKNIVTAVGDQMYASRGAGLSTAATPTGMKLGTGSTAASKTGAGAAVVTYLAGSNKAFDSGFPSVANGVATYKRTYVPGEATSGTPITEVVIVTDAITSDAASSAANTVARAIIANAAAKAAGDTLTLTWTHTLLGS